MAERPRMDMTSEERHLVVAQAPPLIGRRSETEFLRAQLTETNVRLLTLVGAGGAGKTRLAQEITTAVLDVFTDGVFSVTLATVSDATLVASTIAQTLGIRETGDQSLVAAVQGYLRERHTLLVLDNFEQVMDAAPLVAELIDGAPKLTIVVTSRERLHLPGEVVFEVPPLAVPDPQALRGQEGAAAAAMRFEAVQLFVQCARTVQPSFTLADADAEAVAEICSRLDGLPLAIELAAARISLLPPQALLRRLSYGLHLLSGAVFALPPRQQSLRGSIAFSYNLLASDEQQLFRRLAVFVGGCTADSAAAVSPHAQFGLRSLRNKSLMREDQRPDGQQRFVMLETIREYALEQLRASRELDMTQSRHGQFFLEMAEEAEPTLTGPEQQHWLERLAVEHDNMRAALRWAITSEHGAIALRLTGALWRFWHTRGYLSEGQSWLASALDVYTAADPVLRAKAFFAVAALAWAQGNYTEAQSAAETSLALRRELNDVQGIAGSLNVLGLLYQDQGNHIAAQAVLEESNALCRQMGDQRGIGVTLLNLGETARALGDYGKARTLLGESLQELRSVGDTRYIGSALDYLGTVALEQHDYRAARELLAESLALRSELHDVSGIARTLVGLARVIMSKSPDAARAVDAAQLLGAADAARASIGARMHASDQPGYERDLQAIRTHLDPAAFEAAMASGRALPLEHAIADAFQASAFAASA